ncbi:MAG TPA: extracellular solute-binding protein [Limnochordia bacterium]
MGHACDVMAGRHRPLRAAGRALVGCVLVIAAAAAAVSGQERIVLRHLGYIWHGEAWHGYMEAKIAEFERLHPGVTIERTLSGQRSAEMEEKFTTMVAGGVAPDVNEMTLSQGGNLVPQGVFLDLRPLIEADPEIRLTDFAPLALRAITWVDGTLWGLPLDVYPVTTFYNSDLFAQAGLATPGDLAPRAWNWDYAFSAAQKLTVDDNADGQPERWGLETSSTLISYGIPIKQAGGAIYDRYVDPTRSMLTDPRTIRGFEWLAEAFTRGFGGGRFDQGSAAFGITFGPAVIETLQQAAAFQWEIGSPLWGPDNNGSYVAVNSLQLSNYTRHPELAWEWVKFLAADADNMREFVRRTARLPSYRPVLAEYAQLVEGASAGIQHFSDVLTHSASFHPPVGPLTTQVQELIYDTFFSEVVRGGSPVRLMLERLHPQVNAMLAELRQGSLAR